MATGRRGGLEKLLRALVQELPPAMYRAGALLEDAAKGAITSGSVSGKFHVPSSPGEAPNNDTGVLAGNIETLQPEPFQVLVSSNAPYAQHLEYGTSRMAERPYMRPAVAKHRKEVVTIVKAAIGRAVRKAEGA